MNLRDTLIRERFLAEREREAARTAAPPLPFGDGLFDDPTPEFHGTSVGLARHADASQDPCVLCHAWMDELIAAGFAVRLDDGGQQP